MAHTKVEQDALDAGANTTRNTADELDGHLNSLLGQLDALTAGMKGAVSDAVRIAQPQLQGRMKEITNDLRDIADAIVNTRFGVEHQDQESVAPLTTITAMLNGVGH